MPENDASREANLQSSYRELISAAGALNGASDELSSSLRALDDALTGLNIGITSWVTVCSDPHEKAPQYLTEEQLGYARIVRTKGLAIRIVTIDQNEPDEEPEVNEQWLINDAPRDLRLRAVDHIPTLIRQLTAESAVTAKRVRAKADLAKSMTNAVNAIAKGGQR